MHGLRDLRVVDCSTEIAGPYCTKLLADAGADVVKVEPPGGDPLRRWSATGADPGERDGALFRFLHAGTRSVVGELDAPEVRGLLEGADLLVESLPDGDVDVERLRAAHPALVVCSITPFGRRGPYAGRPASEFTIQAESGSTAMRGRPEMLPFQAGGRISEWVSGTFAAVAALAAVGRARATGIGEHVDLSWHEVMTISGGLFLDMMSSLLGRPDWPNPPRTLETPSVEPTADGWVGFNTNTRAQYEAFCVLVERPDLLADDELAQAAGRMRRWDEWNEVVRAWTTRHTTADIVARAAEFRIPVAPVLDGHTVLEHEHLVARGVFVDAPDGDFRAPRAPYLVDGEPVVPAAPAPRSGEHTGRVRWDPRPAPATPGSGGDGPPDLPLAGVRILDLTTWWAGPAATQVLASLGADVVRVESIQRPDGMRFASVRGPGSPDWWEYGFMYLSANTNKRGITLDLTRPEGVELARRLVAVSDAVIENFSPRVVEGFGLGWDEVRARNPRAVMVRMPAFGLDGPWRDHVGFAQTMEQITGMAWITGHPDDQPRIPRGPCDPNAGMHAAFALLVALADRDVTGRGHLVEVPMVEGALNAAAEQVVEYTAYGRLLARMGNRSPEAAPQGLYRCRGEGEPLLAVSVRTDAQWEALRAVLGRPGWADDPALGSLPGRHAAHDRLDDALSEWAGTRDLDAALAELLAAGVPAAPLVDTRATGRHPHLLARGFYEELDHPIVGRHRFPTVPFRYASVDRWLRRPTPTLGEHNREVLGSLLGCSDEELERLEADGIIGTRPAGT